MASNPNPAASVLGKATQRVDGPLKVSGKAKYTADFNLPGMLYAVPVPSTIAGGSINVLETSVAREMPGVKAIYHRENIGELFRVSPADKNVFTYEDRPALSDDVISYYGQYLALVVAETLEQAEAAARAVNATYNQGKPNVDPISLVEGNPEVRSERGDAEKAFREAEIQIDETYSTPAETHIAMELHATVAVWDGASFTLYETTQGVGNSQSVFAQMLGVRREQVRVISKFIGSGFGGKGAPWPHAVLAAAAARNLNRPVKLVVGRQESFQTTGHRPPTVQRIRLGATRDGKLTSLQQDYVNRTSILEDYTEDCGETTSYHYSVLNLRVTTTRAKRNVGTPASMRGPGAVPGIYAIESAMDDLAIRLNMDPMQLRLLNEPELDQGRNIPFSSRHLRECFSLGADRFGWSKRIPAVGSMKRDGLTLGWGVAGCSWIAERLPCDATVELLDNGRARVSCGVQDIGTGTYTVLAQIVGDRLGIPIDRVEVLIGDSALPMGLTSGGSMLTASVVPAVTGALENAIQLLLATAALMPGWRSPGRGSVAHRADEFAYSQGRVHQKGAPAETGIAFGALLKQAQIKSVSGKGSGTSTWDEGKFSKHCYGAHFVEVTWQEEIARLRVSRVVTVIDAGRIFNPLAARNQIEGAVVMGIGMGLFEETSHDLRSGRPLNNNLADYLVATHADVPALEVHFLDYPDTQVNSLGAKGIGEIGLAGVAAALTGAVYHATGVRVRSLPIRIENLLGATSS